MKQQRPTTKAKEEKGNLAVKEAISAYEIPLKPKAPWEFPGGPVVRTHAFTAKGPSSIPGWRTKIPQAMWHDQKINK